MLPVLSASVRKAVALKFQVDEKVYGWILR